MSGPETAGRAVRTAVVGCGFFGARHAEKHAASPRAELVAIVDPDPERRRAAETRHGVRAFADIADLPPEVEAASLAAPTSLHRALGEALLARGVHVLVEKPLADTLAGAEALANEAERRGLVLQVGHIERFSGPFEALREAIDRPVFVECERISPFTGRSADTDVVLDLMIHDIDLVAAVVGSPIAAIEAVGAPVLSARDDIANARLTFESGCVANITASRISFKTQRRMRFFQPDDYVAADLVSKTLTRVRRTAGPDGTPRLDATETQLPAVDSLAREIDAFLRCVATGEPPLVGGRDGAAALRTALEIQSTIRAHRADMAAKLARVAR